MSRPGIPVAKPTIGRIMHVRGTTLDLVRVDLGDHLGWRLVVDGEVWLVSQATPKARWRGVTEDHRLETPRATVLQAVVRWILTHQPQWHAQLRTARERRA